MIHNSGSVEIIIPTSKYKVSTWIIFTSGVKPLFTSIRNYYVWYRINRLRWGSLHPLLSQQIPQAWIHSNVNEHKFGYWTQCDWNHIFKNRREKKNQFSAFLYLLFPRISIVFTYTLISIFLHLQKCLRNFTVGKLGHCDTEWYSHIIVQKILDKIELDSLSLNRIYNLQESQSLKVGQKYSIMSLLILNCSIMNV